MRNISILVGIDSASSLTVKAFSRSPAHIACVKLFHTCTAATIAASKTKTNIAHIVIA